MPEHTYPTAINASDAPERAKQTNYPEPFASRMAGRLKHPLGDLFGLTNFGVNLTRLVPNAVSALRHAHTKQDEFVYILQGHPTLHTDAGRTRLSPGMCAEFKADTGNGHCLVNETEEEIVLKSATGRPETKGATRMTISRHYWSVESGASCTRMAHLISDPIAQQRMRADPSIERTPNIRLHQLSAAPHVNRQARERAPVSDDDWRLQGQERYLLGAAFRLRPWKTPDPQWDHDHCEFCWMEFAGPEVKNALHEGYVTEDLYRWVCPQCFEDMRGRFQFKLLS